MADDLARAQAIGETVQKPKCYWFKDENTPMDGSSLGYVPIYLVQIASFLRDVTVALTGSFSLGSPADAHISVRQFRSGSVVSSVSYNFQSEWANGVTSVDKPDWFLSPGDVLAVMFTQTIPGVSVPGTLLVLTTEPS